MKAFINPSRESAHLLSKRRDALHFLLELLWENPTGPISLKGTVGISKDGSLKDNFEEDLILIKKVLQQFGYEFVTKEEPPTPEEVSLVIKQFQIDHFGPETEQSNYGWIKNSSASSTLKKINEIYIHIDYGVGQNTVNANNIENSSSDVERIHDALTLFGYDILNIDQDGYLESLSTAIYSFQTTEFGIQAPDWKNYGWLGRNGGTIARINKNRNELLALKPKWRYVEFTRDSFIELLESIERGVYFASTHTALTSFDKSHDTKTKRYPLYYPESNTLKAFGHPDLKEFLSIRDPYSENRLLIVSREEVKHAISTLNPELDFTTLPDHYKIKVPTENYWLGKALKADSDFKVVLDEAESATQPINSDPEKATEVVKPDEAVENVVSQTTTNNETVKPKDVRTVDQAGVDASSDVVKDLGTQLTDITQTSGDIADAKSPVTTKSNVIGPEFKEITYTTSKINVHTKLKSAPTKAIFSIEDTVGTGQTNAPQDVATIQKALRELGYKIPEPDANLAATIQGIKSIQREHFNQKNPQGYLGPTGDTLKKINTLVLQKRQSLSHEEIVKNRASDIIVREEVVGKNLPNFKTTVGKSSKSNRNYKRDVIAAQKVLLELGMYPNNALGRKELESNEKSTKTYLDQADVKQTIQAIEKFQNRFHIKELSSNAHDVEHLASLGMDKSLNFYYGSIQPKDATYVVLKSYTRQNIDFYDYKGELVKLVLGNYKYYPTKGYSITRQRDAEHAYQSYGELKFDVKRKNIDTGIFEHIGLNKRQAKALMWVSQNEGGLDAINTYDAQVISVGFSQLAGGGAFEKYVAYIKHREPELFFEYFQKFGIDVEYKIQGGEIADGAIVKVYDTDSKKWKEDVGLWNAKGFDAKREIRENPALVATFIRAAYDPRIQAVQIETTYRHYIEAAESLKLKLSIGTIKITELIKSEMGLAVLYDWTIHRWINEPKDGFTEACQKIVNEKKLTTLDSLKKIDEITILNKLKTAGNKGGFIGKRIEKILAENTEKEKTKTGRKYLHHRLSSNK